MNVVALTGSRRDLHAQEETRQKKPGKRKSVGRKKTNRRKKPIRGRKLMHSKRPAGGSSAQIHQGIGATTTEAGVSMNDVLEDDVTSGRGS